jgi:DNA-binding transcriptional MerR regulator
MTQRAYRSIGDVLTLLRAEFPDITISKIRFLESQGLVSPQRSPSGYRKFYDEDIERLRYVLVQQREHFLPLKVIRDRLNGDAPLDETAPEEPEAIEATADGESTDAASLAPVVALVVDPPVEEPAPVVEAAPRADPPKEQPRVAAKEPSISDVVAALQEAPTKSTQRKATRPAPIDPPDEPSEPAVEGETLSVPELATELGVDDAFIESLVDYGVIKSVTIGGLVCFDENNVTIARIASGFATHGIEPRHLRQFRTSIDREMGLIDQVVAPLLRQRNPEARKKATANAKELAKLGRDLRSAMVTQELRDYFRS